MRRPLVLLGLTWASFLLFFVFVPLGNSSYQHIAFHVTQLPVLGTAAVLAWRVRRDAPTRTQRALGWVLSVTLPLAFVGIATELVTAVVRLASDGLVNRDTTDIWEGGAHAMAANLSVPAILLSALTAAAFVLVRAVQRRRGRSLHVVGEEAA